MPIWILDRASREGEQVPHVNATDTFPCWLEGEVYFASDRDGTLNLFSWDPRTDTVAKLTTSTTWDVRWPSSDNASRIVYELNGELQVLDVKTRQSKPTRLRRLPTKQKKRPSKLTRDPGLRTRDRRKTRDARRSRSRA